MKITNTLILAAAIILAGTAIGLAKPMTETTMLSFSERMAEASKRPCSHSGNGTQIDTDNTGSTASAELNEWSRYVVQCQDESYICWGSSGTTCTASTTTDLSLPADSWYEFITTPDSKYIGLRNVNTDSTCNIQECL